MGLRSLALGLPLLLILMVIILLSAAHYAVASTAPQEHPCFPCHGVQGTGAPYLDPEVFSRSVHGEFGCVICHPDAARLPHPEELQRADPFQCARCHGEITRVYQESIHGKALAQGEEDVANCKDCHGTHDILPKDDPSSHVFPLNLPATCGRCHGDIVLAEKHAIPIPEAYQSYMQSIHGAGLYRVGLLFSATCKDCHGAHEIQLAQDPRSLINPKNLPNTCGKCHRGVLKDYKRSIHGRLWEAGSPHAPVCNDCHRSHGVSPATSEEFELASIRACGECHREPFETYRETYHGQVSTLGYTGVATCSDCHGYHKILPAYEPESTLSSQNIIATCRKCHPKANANFAKFIPHADPKKGNNFLLHFAWIFMTTLLILVLGFFGLHTMLWAIRGYISRLGGEE